MTRKLVQGIVSDRSRHVIHVVRVLDDILDFSEINEIADRMCARVLAKHGDQTPNVVVVQGDSKETLRLSARAMPSESFVPHSSMRPSAGRRLNSMNTAKEHRGRIAAGFAYLPRCNAWTSIWSSTHGSN